jgi:hypothetical protein
VPDRASKVDDRTEVLTYVLKNDATGGLEITLPIIGSGYKVGGGASNCNAHFRVVGGRVACPASGPMRQLGRVEKRRIPGSS